MALITTGTSSFDKPPEILTLLGNTCEPNSAYQEQIVSDSPMFVGICGGWSVVTASSFNDSGAIENIDLKKENDNKLSKFQVLIKQRIEYIDSLLNIPDDWISGKSTKPSKEVIRLAKILLATLFYIVRDNTNTEIPKLLLGPIPSGGISISIIYNSQNKISVSFFNEEESEIDYFESGNYKCEDLEKAKTISRFEVLIRKIIN